MRAGTLRYSGGRPRRTHALKLCTCTLARAAKINKQNLAAAAPGARALRGAGVGRGVGLGGRMIWGPAAGSKSGMDSDKEKQLEGGGGEGALGGVGAGVRTLSSDDVVA